MGVVPQLCLYGQGFVGTRQGQSYHTVGHEVDQWRVPIGLRVGLQRRESCQAVQGAPSWVQAWPVVRLVQHGARHSRAASWVPGWCVVEQP